MDENYIMKIKNISTNNSIKYSIKKQNVKIKLKKLKKIIHIQIKL